MEDEHKTHEQLCEELTRLRQRVAELESKNSGHQTTHPHNDGAASPAQEERDRLQAILAAAVDCLPFEVFAMGTDGRCMLQNARGREHYGNALGKSVEEIAPDEATLQLWRDNNRRAFSGQRVDREIRYPLGGQVRTCHTVIVPIRDQEHLYGILGVNVDISEQKQIEEALKQSQVDLERRIEQQQPISPGQTPNCKRRSRYGSGSRKPYVKATSSSEPSMTA
jgi:PAS domain S-box-containing protein